MKGYKKYLLNKTVWFVVTLFAAIILNFILPRLTPIDPISIIVARVAQGAEQAEVIRRIYEHYYVTFGLDKSVVQQFFIWLGNIFRGDFGISFTYYPRPVMDIIMSALPWTIALQLPAIIVGWTLGNILGAIAAYIRKGFDSVIMPAMLFVGGIPAFGMAVILLAVFAVGLGWFPVQGGYPLGMFPNFSWDFITGVIRHYHLPFWSIVLISVGGQSLGMRSMSIYELNADYVKYARFLGIKDSKIVGYVFRNAMLPQVTGLALQIGGIVGGALVSEIIFSYPGLGTIILRAIKEADYPMISGVTLIITIMVLIMVFILDLIYGLIDPRIKATQQE